MLNEAVARGDMIAHHKLGSFYVYGYGFDGGWVDFASDKRREGVQLIERAAIDGDPVAQVALGKLYRSGLVVERNIKKAKHWYCKAGSLGLAKWGGVLVCKG